MLQESKTITTICGERTCELREGITSKGNPCYIVVSYLGFGYNRSYHEERFNDFREALWWFDNM